MPRERKTVLSVNRINKHVNGFNMLSRSVYVADPTATPRCLPLSSPECLLFARNICHRCSGLKSAHQKMLVEARIPTGLVDSFLYRKLL